MKTVTSSQPAHPVRSSPAARAIRVRHVDGCGMEPGASAALAALDRVARNGRTAVAGVFLPSPWVRRALGLAGITEDVELVDAGRFERVVVPYCGMPASTQAAWQAAGIELVDLSAGILRHARDTAERLSALRAEVLVVGRHHDDCGTSAISDDGRAARVIESTEDTARLAFAPHFGVVCKPWLSPRRVSWLVQQLRPRYRDARVTFIDTGCPGMVARERALEAQLAWCDRVVIVGDPGDDTCAALAETADRRGVEAAIATTADRLPWRACDGPARRIAIAAGAFTPRPAIDAMARALRGG